MGKLARAERIRAGGCEDVKLVREDYVPCNRAANTILHDEEFNRHYLMCPSCATDNENSMTVVGHIVLSGRRVTSDD